MQNVPISFSSPLFHEVWLIYESSFPEDERRDIARQKAISANPRYSLLASHEEGQIIGFISYWKLDDFAFIEHLAIRTGQRSRGLGAAMLADFLKGKKKIIIEVEKPLTDEQKRRIRFYERAGFHPCGFDYIQPAYGPGKNPVRMALMSYPRALDRKEFEDVRREIHRTVYSLETPLV